MSAPTLALVTDAGALHAQRWAMAFRDRGWQVRLLTWGSLADLPGIETIPVLDARPGAGRGPLSALTGYRQLRQRLEEADLVHVHSLPAGRWVTCLTGLPRLMITSWGTDAMPRQGALSAAQKRWVTYGLRQAQAIGAYSQFARTALIRHYRLPDARVHWTPLGVDLTCFDASRFPTPPAEPLVIGFFKHLRPIYGPQVLLEALSLFRHQWTGPWEARLYGGGPLQQDLARRIDELQLQEHVRLAGRVRHEDLPAAMAACHLVVSPSLVEESLGLASLEAQALGLPVINSGLGGMPETCVPGESGFLAPPGEPAALASLLLRLARDPALRAQMGQRGRQFVHEAGYVWAKCVDRADAIQRSLLVPREK